MLTNLAILLWLPGLLTSSFSSSYSYSVQEESWVSLSGSSNINTFECFSNTDPLRGNLLVTINGNDNAISFTNAQMKLNIRAFDCNNPLLNKDFYKSLGADKAPFISIELIDVMLINQKESGSKHKGSIMASIAITLNEKCKMVEVPIEWQQVGNFLFRFDGNKELNMTDFNISPPSPVFGLIKVNNEISITFSLLVEASSMVRTNSYSEAIE